ncbi:MAG: hypothetical protein ACOCQY_05155 [Halorhabdus sp.]
MARGIAAAIFVVSLTFSMMILGGVGYYSSMGVDMDASGQNADVEKAAQQLSGVEFGEGRSASILEGPLAAVMPVVDMAQSFTAIISNTSGVLQLLYGVPAVVGDILELMFRIAMVVTFIYLIRSGSPV